MPVLLTLAAFVVVLGVLGGRALTAQDTGPDKHTVQVPGGLAFSEFRGYESWQVVSISQDGPVMAAILANPVMINAYRAGIPCTIHVALRPRRVRVLPQRAVLPGGAPLRPPRRHD